MSLNGQDAKVAVVVAGHFDLPRGVWFDTHEHPVHQLAWAARGVLSVRARGRTWVLPPGLALWIPAGTEHATGTTSAADMLGVYLPPKRSPIRWREPTVVVIDPLSRELLTYLSEHDGPTPVRTHAEALLFDQLRPAPDVRVDVPHPVEDRAGQIAAALSRDPTDRRTLEEWGRVVGASSRTLARTWLAETGLGFARWRTRCRVHAALPLLADGTAVQVVARRVGYETPSAFVAAFRREVGVSPGSYFSSAS